MSTNYDKEWLELVLKHAWKTGLRGFALRKCKRRWAKALREFQKGHKDKMDTFRTEYIAGEKIKSGIALALNDSGYARPFDFSKDIYPDAYIGTARCSAQLGETVYVWEE